MFTIAPLSTICQPVSKLNIDCLMADNRDGNAPYTSERAFVSLSARNKERCGFTNAAAVTFQSRYLPLHAQYVAATPL